MDELKGKLKSLFGSKGSGSKSGAFSGTGHKLGSASAQPSRPAARAPAPATHRPILAPPPPPPQQPQQQLAPNGNGGAGSSSGIAAVAGPAAPLQAAVQPAGPQPPPPPPQQQQVALPPPPGEAPEEVQAAVAQLGSDPEGAAAAAVLARLLGNVAAAPNDPRFRRLRLGNPRIAAVAHANGGIELLLACGFEIHFEEAAGAASGDASAGNADGEAEQAQEGFAVLPEGADMAPLQHAVHLLGALLPPPPSSAAAAVSNSSSRSSSLSAAGALPAAQQPARPGQQQRAQRPPREWEAPRERNTQVLLPTSVERDVPEWFFNRTGAELKAAFTAAVRRREQDQVLMTRATRERMRGGGPVGPAPTFATIRVRFPEGISLQGEFGAGEPVTAVFAWVADCLSDPLHTYELVLPSRRTLEVQSQSVREADLLPSVVLLFRWTGQSAVEMAQAPALRPDLLRAAKPALVAY
ncbi:hypothetical protein ABPG75_009661 [Micractinium tetrahymenae]